MYINKEFSNSESTKIIYSLWTGFVSTPNMLNKLEILQTTGKLRKCGYLNMEIEKQIVKVDNPSDLHRCSVGVELIERASKHSS